MICYFIFFCYYCLYLSVHSIYLFSSNEISEFMGSYLIFEMTNIKKEDFAHYFPLDLWFETFNWVFYDCYHTREIASLWCCVSLTLFSLKRAATWNSIFFFSVGMVGDDDVADYKVFSDFLLKEQFVFIYHLYELLFVIIIDLYLLRLAAATAGRIFYK